MTFRNRYRFVGAEVLRNLSSMALRTLALVLLCGTVAFGLAAAELSFAANAINHQKDLAEAGESVLVATDDSISLDHCEALERNPSVVVVGAAARSEPVRLRSAPNRVVSSEAVTRQFLDLIAPGVPMDAASAVVGAELATELGLVPNSTRTLTSGRTLHIDEVVLSKRSQSTNGRMLFLDPGLEEIQQCWVEFTNPSAAEIAAQTLGGGVWFEQSTIIRRLIRPDEFSRDLESEFLVRPAPRLAVILGATLGLIFALALWLRRTLVGLYRAMGMSPAEVVLYAATEYWLAASIGGTAGLAIAVSLARLDPNAVVTRQTVLFAADAPLLALALGGIAVPLAALAIARSSLSQLLKDR